ncbi:hypothetical protein C1I97_01075 [Streptomyces sp. NTH33]|nr:hypothetical protein C1I97_01075 [Streptomyces sp. NTH33]
MIADAATELSAGRLGEPPAGRPLPSWQPDLPEPLRGREATGSVHDRDHHAAITIEQAAGLTVTACGAPVRPDPGPARAPKRKAEAPGFRPEGRGKPSGAAPCCSP